MIASLFTILYIVYIVLGVLFYDLHYCSYIDEIYPWLLLSVLLFSRRKFSKSLAVWLCIALFYLLYSFAIASNTNEAILSDFIAETKSVETILSAVYSDLDCRRNHEFRQSRNRAIHAFTRCEIGIGLCDPRFVILSICQQRQ